MAAGAACASRRTPRTSSPACATARPANFRGDDPHARLTQQIEAASHQSYDQLKADHEKDFHALYDRVALDLGKPGDDVAALPTDKRIFSLSTKDDPDLEQLLFQYGRYNLIACSRQALPANLQGLWNDDNKPQWACDYHSNINLEMNYWAAEPANLAECHLPLFNWMQSQLDPWRKNTQEDKEFQLASGAPIRGWAVRTMLNPFGGGVFTWDKTANAWLCQHLMGALRFRRRQGVAAKHGLPGDERNLPVLGGPPESVARWTARGAEWLVAGARPA